MIRLTSTLAAAFLLALTISGCPTEADCTDGDHQCDGDQIQTCVDGEWGAAEECTETGETCMAMDDGTQHCMGSM